MDPVEEVKQRLDVSEVVGGYVQLKPAGANHRGICPFHHEKTPSFMVSDEKGIWHCFGCGESGDIFTFVQKMEGLDFRNSLETLARRAGVTLPAAGTSKATGDLKDRLYKMLELATKYYQTALVKSSLAQNYVIKTRGFNKESLTNFRIGYAVGGHSNLISWLSQRGFTNSEIIKAGLARQSSGKLQDLFRNRVMLPLADVQGRTVGFTGRVLDQGEPKYLNTPQTMLFDKSRYVYGFSQAKAAIRQNDEAVVVEGNLDVITAHQYGSKTVVATSGTALTSPQLKILARLTKNVKLAFDTDSAGLSATERAIPLAQAAGLTLYIVELPAKDPDELIRKDQAAWAASLKSAPYVMDWLIKTLQQKFDSTTATGKKQIADRFSLTLARLADPVEQDHYAQSLAKAVNVETASIWRKLEQQASTAKNSAATLATLPNPTKKTGRSDGEAVQEAILSLSLTYTDTRVSLDDLSEDHFTTPDRQTIFTHLQGDAKLNPEALPEPLKPLSNYVKILLLQGEENYRDWAALDRRIEAFSLAQRLKSLKLKKLKQNLQVLIARAETSGDQSAREQLLKQFRDLAAL